MEGETVEGAKHRKKLEAIDRQISKEICPYCGEQLRYYAKSDKPICPYCGVELPKLKEGGKE